MVTRNGVLDAGFNRRSFLRSGLAAPAVLTASSLLAPTETGAQAATPAPVGPILTREDLPKPLHQYPLVKEKKTFTALVPHMGVDWANNEMTTWYEELTGVHIEWQVAEDNGAMQQLSLAMASGDYPDIILGFGPLTPTAIATYGAQGQFVPLNDYVAENAPHMTTQVVKEYPLASRLMTMSDGAVYSMPYVNDCYHCQFWNQRMWINTTWLDGLGLAMPETTDEFTEVLKAFRDDDPNGNGKQDELPLTANVTNPLTAFLVNPFTPSPGKPWLYLDDGKIAASYMHEGFLEAATYLAGLTAEGLLDGEAFTRDDDQYRSLGDAPDGPRIGAAPAGWVSSFVTANEGTRGSWTDYGILSPLAGPEGVRRIARNYDNAVEVNRFVVTDRCDDPALAVAWCDGFYEFEATMRATEGALDVNWRYAEDGEIGVDGRPALWSRIPQETPATGGSNTTTWRQRNPSFRSEAIRLGQAQLVDPAVSIEAILFTGCHERLDPFAEPPEADLLPPEFSPDAALRVTELETTLTQYIDETFARIATGQVDADWNDFQDNLASLGVDEYLQLYSDAL